ncbi:hypothetical protein GWI33_003104, partial [Rhynchophorus ferrugineus]
MRKSFDGLCGLVISVMQRQPTSGEVFVFLNRSRTHMKLLHWEKGGFVLYHKRLERGTFLAPGVNEGEFSWSDLVLMVEGIQFAKTVIYPYFYSMETALENLSKEDLLKVVSSRDQALAERDEKIGYLEFQLAMYKRMQFGQKRERFEGDPNQTELPFEAAPIAVEQQQEETKQKIEYTRKRPNHKGRAKLPEHLPVEEIEIHPEGDLSDMICIGKEITEELECEPAKFYIKRYIRYKYAAKNGDGVRIGELPERVIDKGIPGAGLLAMILTG